MVAEAITAVLGNDRTNAERLRSVSWLDPSAGDGAFVLGILRYYVKVLGPEMAVEFLPRITAIDLSQTALKAAKANVDDYLQRVFNLPSSSFSIKFEVANTLELYGDQPVLSRSREVFDVVIGNPPYIRHSHLSLEDRALSKALFPALFGGSADYFTFFFGAALNAIDEYGVVTFVTPASFARNAAGIRVRQRITERAAILSFIDLDELSVFNDAEVHTAITTVGVGRKQGHVKFKRYESINEIIEDVDSASKPVERSLQITAMGGWRFSAIHSNKASSANSFPTLEGAGIRVRSGVRSGAASIFLISNEQAKQFSELTRSGWLRKIVLPTDIRPESVDASKWIIWTHREAGAPPEELLKYLGRHRERLEKRPEVQNGATPWFSLRPCSYGELLFKECIVSPDITVTPRFAKKSEGVLISDGGFAIDSTDSALVAILNSSWAEGFFRSNASSVGSLESRGRLRIKANLLRKFPVPYGTKTDEAQLDLLRDLWDDAAQGGAASRKKVDDLVDEIYGSVK